MKSRLGLLADTSRDMTQQLALGLAEPLPMQERPPIPPTRPQGKKALAMLEAARERGVSGVEFVANYLFAYSQEVGRLRKLGYQIVSGKMRDSQVAMYWLAEYAPKDVPA